MKTPKPKLYEVSAALREFLKGTTEELQPIATACGTNVAYLLHLRGGHRAASPKLARKLVAASRGRLSLEDALSLRRGT